MQPVKNKTTQLLVLTGPSAETCAIKPGLTRDVPDAVWAHMKDRPSVQAMIDDRSIIVVHGATEPKAKPEAKTEAKTEESDWLKLHWKKAQKLIAKETDTETLSELLEGEMRPKFQSMLRTRLTELAA